MPLAAPLADPPPSSRLHRPPRRPPYNLRSVAFSVGTLMWLVTIAHGPHPGTDIVAARVRARTLDLNQLSAPSARWENLTEATDICPPKLFRPGDVSMSPEKTPKFSGAYAHAPEHYKSTRRETHHQISPHILNIRLQPFFSQLPVCCCAAVVASGARASPRAPNAKSPPIVDEGSGSAAPAPPSA